MKKYFVGVDFGTLSARCVLIDSADGVVIAGSEQPYQHGVMDHQLPDGSPLPERWALHHPQDYLACLETLFRSVISEAGIQAEQIAAVGIDSTASTLLSVDEEGVPLCLKAEFAAHPHAYALLWKHHGAEKEAKEIEVLAHELDEGFIHRCGGKVSSEWSLPKILQILREAPEIYQNSATFVDACDWLNFCLTGTLVRSGSCLGFKLFWDETEGFPSERFMARLDPRLEKMFSERFGQAIGPLGGRAGVVSAKGAALTGLAEGTVVAVGKLDAHVSVACAGVTEPGKMMMIIGTSACHIFVAEEFREVPGCFGIVRDGVIPGYWGYEAGQSGVGDIYQWFIENCVPEKYMQASRASGVDIHTYLSEKARGSLGKNSQLLALDWWNGNRSFLVDTELSGLIVGLNLMSRPEDIYLALIESTALGTRNILETFKEQGFSFDELVVCGGIAIKNPFVMQVYANVLGIPVRVVDSKAVSAVSAAIFAAVAAGKSAGGYDTIGEAAQLLSEKKITSYEPEKELLAGYDAKFAEYMKLYRYFGQGDNPVMKVLGNTV